MRKKTETWNRRELLRDFRTFMDRQDPGWR